MKKIKYEFPVRFCFWYGEERDRKYIDTLGFFNPFLLEATTSWKESEMTQYLPENLKSKVFESFMILTNFSFHDDDLGLFCHLAFEVDDSFCSSDSLSLMNWIIGQMSDGWGEGFEQRPFASFVYHTENEEYDESPGRVSEIGSILQSSIVVLMSSKILLTEIV